jgi:dihydropteroate synthase
MTNPRILKTRFGDLDFTQNKTHIMGVINLSPDSQQKHTIAHSPEQALSLARTYRDWGAHIIDLGAQSSHYENQLLTPEAEIERLLPALKLLAAAELIVSVDTWKPQVAAAALAEGAAIINDTSGLTQPAMVEIIQRYNCPVIPVYVEARNPLEVGELKIADNKAQKTIDVLRARLQGFRQQGIEQLILDPGIAINYQVDYLAYTRQQLAVIRDTGLFKQLNYPVLIPIPRKKPGLNWVAAYITLAIEYGADLIRVHDVELAADLVRLLR